MTNRERAARATRRRIVDAAARLFVRDGYSETSIADIAAAADVAVPTVYAGLRSKANILRAVVESTLRGDHEGGSLGQACRVEGDGGRGGRTREAGRLRPDPHRRVRARSFGVRAARGRGGKRRRSHRAARGARPQALRDPEQAGAQPAAGQAAQGRADRPQGRRLHLGDRQRTHLPRAGGAARMEAARVRALGRRAAGGRSTARATIRRPPRGKPRSAGSRARRVPAPPTPPRRAPGCPGPP